MGKQGQGCNRGRQLGDDRKAGSRGCTLGLGRLALWYPSFLWSIGPSATPFLQHKSPAGECPLLLCQPSCHRHSLVGSRRRGFAPSATMATFAKPENALKRAEGTPLSIPLTPGSPSHHPWPTLGLPLNCWPLPAVSGLSNQTRVRT